MGFIKDISGNVSGKPFPGASFVASGTIPKPECTKARIEGDNATVAEFNPRIFDGQKFEGESFIGDDFTVLSPAVTVPNQVITDNTAEWVEGPNDMGVDSNDTVYYLHGRVGLEETRTAQSIMQFALDNGYAATIKGGQVFTDMPSAELALACRITFAPLT